MSEGFFLGGEGGIIKFFYFGGGTFLRNFTVL